MKTGKEICPTCNKPYIALLGGEFCKCEIDATHTDPEQIETGVVLKYSQRARVAEEALLESEKTKALMLGFLQHYFEAHETRSRVNEHVHTKCEKIIKEIK